ncbi:MAG: YmdB family metallophosphoesterase, partial [Synergistaceae bacterium]|nr:YmdB family metallophosphoesterase [Synergistaceae bacterium]
GRVSAVVGTHTHVQTADERIFSKGTAYISDAGMTGGHRGILGVKYESVMPKFIDGLPCKFEASEGGAAFNGVIVDVDDDTGLAVGIERVQVDTENLT